MNTVLDDNKMLCLANSERIKFTPFIHMLFEVADLAVASPATVSRCGMVYVDPNELKWLPYVKTWLAEHKRRFKEETFDYVLDLFIRYVDDGLKFISKKCTQAIKQVGRLSAPGRGLLTLPLPAQVDIAKVTMLCKLFESLLLTPGGPDLSMDMNRLHPLLCTTFVFCYLWTIGGNIIDANWDTFDTFVRNQFDDNGDAKVRPGGKPPPSFAKSAMCLRRRCRTKATCGAATWTLRRAAWTSGSGSCPSSSTTRRCPSSKCSCRPRTPSGRQAVTR